MATAFRTSLNLCATVTMAAGLLATSAAAESVLVTDPGQRQVRNNGTTDYQGTLGYDITVGSADVQVTHLGVWDGPGNEADTSDGQPGDGLEQSAAVGIYKASDQTLIV